MGLTKQNMPETQYRASRCCRVLGNPTAYLILRFLGMERKTPSQMSENLNIPISTISGTLRHLRQMDLVRYETNVTSKEYWIKDKNVIKILDALETLVESIRKKRK